MQVQKYILFKQNTVMDLSFHCYTEVYATRYCNFVPPEAGDGRLFSLCCKDFSHAFNCFPFVLFGAMLSLCQRRGMWGCWGD